MKEDPTLGRIGGFRLIRLLSSGDAAEVLLARSAAPSGLERTVVLKRLLPQHVAEAEVARTFAREAAAYSRLNHPCVVRLLDFFTSSGQPIMVFEHVDGVTLAQLMLRTIGVGKGFDDSAALFIGLRLFEALAAAHGARDPETGDFASIVHRDASPANLLLPWDGNAKLTDFGVAKVMRPDGETKTGAAVARGAFGYMAPEQVTGERVTARSDVYTASIVLWELLARRRAILTDKLSDYEALRVMAEPQVPSLDAIRPELSPALLDAVSRGIEAQAKSRTVSADEMVGVIRELIGSTDAAREAVVTLLKPLRAAALRGTATVRTIGIAASALSALDEPMRRMTPASMQSVAASPPSSSRPLPPRPVSRPSIPAPVIPAPIELSVLEEIANEPTITDVSRPSDAPARAPAPDAERRSLPPPLPLAMVVARSVPALVSLVDDDDSLPPFTPGLAADVLGSAPVYADIRLDVLGSSAPPPAAEPAGGVQLVVPALPPPPLVALGGVASPIESPGSPPAGVPLAPLPPDPVASVVASAPRAPTSFRIPAPVLVAVVVVACALAGLYARRLTSAEVRTARGGHAPHLEPVVAVALPTPSASPRELSEPQIDAAPTDSASPGVDANVVSAQGTTGPAAADASAAELDAASLAASAGDAGQVAVAAASGAGTGELRLPARSAGRRVWIDGKLAGEGPAPLTVACGSHTVKIGSSGVDVVLEVPCGGVGTAQ